MKIDPQDAHKCAFSTPYGHWQFRRMAFGLKNAPPSFQRLINLALEKLLGKVCLVYIDDIIIFARSLKEHAERFKMVMEALAKFNLKLQIDKSEFLRRSVTYLGHIISKYYNF